MTIRKGEPWGEPAIDPCPALEADVDADVARLAGDALERGEHAVIGLTFGSSARRRSSDLARTLGIGVLRPPSERLAYRCDLGLVRLDGGHPLPFAAHVVARRRLWRGPFLVVMNAAWVGEWYLGPRAHPNDGLLDVTSGSLPPVQRLLARRRAPAGSHLPHPGLAVTRSKVVDHAFDRPIPVLIDGRSAGRARSLTVELVTDCFTLIA